MSQSCQYEVEDAVADLLTGISGLNVYTTNRTGRRLFPYATISASLNSQLLGNYTGVYDLNVAVNYSDTAAKISQEDFDSQYCQIFEAFYEETPTLAYKIQDKILNTKIYMARILSQSPTIRTNKRAWQRGLTLNVIATPSELSDGLRDYDFSDALNSFYLGTI
ncbi:MAG: hypothetical protein EBR82_66610 [Caulobacteraceae bacterium]|nr:hypothetical protein [Caulobacteraceae bacterium]